MKITGLFASSQHEILEVFNRQLGFSSPKLFSRRLTASEALVSRIGVSGELIGHEGSVNTVEFNYCGDVLVSGSDDRQVMLWNVTTKSLLLSYASGHVDRIFQARIMPFTDDCSIVTSAADGQVRLGKVTGDGRVETKLLGEHDGRVHKLAVEPGSSHIFYSCGEDGLVQHGLASGNAGRPVNTFCPKHLIKTHDTHVTGMSYSNTSELLVSYSSDLISLFQKDMGLGPYPVALSKDHLDSLEEPQTYSGHRNSLTLKGVSFFGPNSEYVMSGSDCGHIFIWSKKDGRFVHIMEGDRHIVSQVEPHPNIPVLASSGLEKSIKLWAPVL